MAAFFGSLPPPPPAPPAFVGLVRTKPGLGIAGTAVRLAPITAFDAPLPPPPAPEGLVALNDGLVAGLAAPREPIVLVPRWLPGFAF